MKTLKLLVVGDLILDTYYVSDELSAPPEGTTVFAKNARRVERPGGAGRVAWAASKMGAVSTFWAAKYSDEDAIGMFGDGLPDLVVHGFPFSVHHSNFVNRKIRLVAGGRVVTRIDPVFHPSEVSYDKEDTRLQDGIFQLLLSLEYDAAVFSDYAKGTFLGNFGYLLAGVAKGLSEHMPVVVAPRDMDLWSGLPVTVVVNRAEAEKMTGCAGSTAEELAYAFWSDWRHRSVVVTDGPRGAAVSWDGVTGTSPPDVKRIGLDTTGAGDAFVAALALYQAKGHPPGDACLSAVNVASAAVDRPDVTDVIHPNWVDLFKPGGAANPD